MKKWQRFGLMLALPVVVSIPTGCGTNPVTGQSEIQVLSEGQEISIGAEHFETMIQLGGGRYTAHPQVQRYVEDIGYRLAAESHRPDLPYEFVVLNNSIPNAWALPGGKIAVNRGLLTRLGNEAQLAALLGHEITHAAARHAAKGIERSMLLQTGARGIAELLGDRGSNELVTASTEVGLGIINAQYSQQQELQADYYGVEYMVGIGYDPSAAVALQETFVRLSDGGSPTWISGLFATHPPSTDRVRKIKENLKQYAPGGVLGVDDYERAIAELKDEEEAYELMEQGYAALNAKDYKRAEELGQRALRIAPYEAHTYALVGKAEMAQEKYRAAQMNFNRAIQIHGCYFDFYLQRGLANRGLCNIDAAIDDLEKANQLLATAQAHSVLADIYLDEGKHHTARKHYEAAAETDTIYGEKARKVLDRMDLEGRVRHMVSLTQQLNEDGFVSFTATNESLIPLQNIKMRVSDERYGREGWTVIEFDEVLDPGESQTISTRIGPFGSRDELDGTISTRVLSADEQGSEE